MKGPSNEELQQAMEEKNVIAICLSRHDAESIIRHTLLSNKVKIIADPNTDLVFVVEDN